ncbi:MAG: SDR family oxidoreductase [Bryobacterales bacterium]|nr:SDR family oxidoreductase [Bryobacterales bacterium]
MESSLHQRTVLITGATGGLGRTVTQTFLDAGAAVYGVVRKWKRDEIPAGAFKPVEADVTKAADCRASLARVLAEANRLDAVVHLAGGFAGGSRVEETDEATWDHMLNLNLRSAFLLFREALPVMRGARHGRLIAIGSRVGAEPAASMAAYVASKAALHALIQAIAAETKGTGITANALLPSIIDTPANRAAMPQADFSKWVAPRSIAACLVWLASDASADVTGALVPIYGGV